MSCSTIAIIAGAVIVVMLLWACSQSPLSKAEREERRFRDWKRRDDSNPPEDHE